MRKKMIIVLIIGIIVLVLAVLGIIKINKNEIEKFNTSAQKQLANVIEKNENVETIPTLANENVILQNENIKDKEEYILRENNGYIAIYKLNEEKKEVLFEVTDIAIAYLTDVDKLELDRGIKIYGKEQLNSRLEDYE